MAISFVNLNPGKFTAAVILAFSLTALLPAAYGNEPGKDKEEHAISENARDAWIQGKLESVYLFNQHLNPFKIDVDVEDGRVSLSGVVESDIDKDLAGEIAKGIEDVTGVENNLEVEAGTRVTKDGADADSFEQFVTDVSITASVKSKLLANDNTGGMDINVDTKQGIVSLKGEVDSEQEKELAEQIARNSDNVKEVKNELMVVGM